MTDNELFSGAFRTLLCDLFAGIAYYNKTVSGTISQKELLDAAAGTLWFYLNDDGRAILRTVVESMNESENIPRGALN